MQQYTQEVLELRVTCTHVGTYLGKVKPSHSDYDLIQRSSSASHTSNCNQSWWQMKKVADKKRLTQGKYGAIGLACNVLLIDNVAEAALDFLQVFRCIFTCTQRDNMTQTLL